MGRNKDLSVGLVLGARDSSMHKDNVGYTVWSEAKEVLWYKSQNVNDAYVKNVPHSAMYGAV